jgi:hypothetical protein
VSVSGTGEVEDIAAMTVAAGGSAAFVSSLLELGVQLQGSSSI